MSKDAPESLFRMRYNAFIKFANGTWDYDDMKH